MAAHFARLVESYDPSRAATWSARRSRRRSMAQHLSLPELAGICLLLLLAGNETTSNLVSNVIMRFDESSDVVDERRASQSNMPAVIKEVLRFVAGAVDIRVVVRSTQLRSHNWSYSKQYWPGSARRTAASKLP